jgi:hypothetical protein
MISKSTPSMTIRSASHLRSSSPALYSQWCASIGLMEPQWTGARRAICSAAACRMTTASNRFGAATMLHSTKFRGVLGGQPVGLEAHPGRRGLGQAVDAEGPPVAAKAIPCDEIPAVAVIDDPQNATFIASQFVPENKDLATQTGSAASAA